jgi:hypothetical protein
MSITWSYNSNPEGTNWEIGLGKGCIWVHELLLFVAVGTQTTGHILTSPDGVTWTAHTPSENNKFNSVCWSPSLSLLVAVTEDGTHRVWTSANGTSWNPQTAAEANRWKSVAWSSSLNLFVAVAESGTHRVMTSANGTAWSTQTITAQLFQRVIWADTLGLFLAFTDKNSTAKIYTSSNGTGWSDSSPTLNSSEFIGDICWSNALSLLVMTTIRLGTFTNRVRTSTNGTSWSIGSSIPDNGGGFDSVCWLAAQTAFIATARGSAPNNVMSSADGFTWTYNTDVGNSVICWAVFPSEDLGKVVVFDASFNTGEISLGAFGPPPPIIITISPDNGPAQGGTTVTLTASASLFNSSTKILFGGVEGTSYNVISPTSMTCITPRNLPAQYTVVVRK